MKHLLLLNPRAGTGSKQEEIRARAEEVFLGEDFSLITTQSAGHAYDLARAAAASGEQVRIYACGGDGTLNEVVRGAAGFENAAVTHVPMGTGNDFLRLFGKDAVPRFLDLAALKDGPQSAFDLMDCNGQLGLNVICAGVDARVAADVERYKALPLVSGTGAYVLSLIVNIAKGITRDITVEVNGDKLEGCSILCICNGRYYGGGFMPVGEAMPDDGILNVLYVPKISRFQFLRFITRYSTGRYHELPEWVIRGYSCTAVRLSAAEPITAVVDGEVVRTPVLSVSLAKEKVNFFYPPGLSYLPAPEFLKFLSKVSTPPASL